MKLKFKILAALVVAGSSVSSAIDTKWHTYSLYRFPKGKLSCAETAQDIGGKFEKATGQAIFRASCEKDSSLGYDLQVSYGSLTPVPLISTANEQGGIGYLGLYRSIGECQAAIPKEEKSFSENTGLAPFVSYCYKESDLSKTPYTIRVDGFGAAKLLPHRFEGTVYVDSIQSAEAVLNGAVTFAKKAGIRVHQAALAHDGSLKLVIRYYLSPADVAFHSHYFRLDQVTRYSSLGTRKPQEVCEVQMKEAQTGFSSSYGTPGIWFCGWDGMLFDAKLYLLRVRPQEGVNTDTLPDRFSTFAECSAERAHAKSWYEKTFGVSPFSVLCSWKSGLGTGKPDAFVIKVLTKIPELEPPGGLDPDLGFGADSIKGEAL